MSKINLATGKPLLSSDELDRLLNSDVSDTEIVSATELNVSATENSNLVSATEISATDNRSKYQNEWKRTHKDTVRIDVPKGYKDLLKQEASKRGMSLTKLFLTAVVEYLKTK